MRNYNRFEVVENYNKLIHPFRHLSKPKSWLFFFTHIIIATEFQTSNGGAKLIDFEADARERGKNAIFPLFYIYFYIIILYFLCKFSFIRDSQYQWRREGIFVSWDSQNFWGLYVCMVSVSFLAKQLITIVKCYIWSPKESIWQIFVGRGWFCVDIFFFCRPRDLKISLRHIITYVGANIHTSI